MKRVTTLAAAALLIGCTAAERTVTVPAVIGDTITRPVAVAAIAAEGEAGAAAGGGAVPDRRGPWSVGGALGFTIDPSCFLTAFEADYAVTRNLLVGPLLQVAVSDEEEVVAPSLNVQYLIDLPESTAFLDRLKPFAQVGMGFAYIEKERRGRSDKDDLGFLLNVGFGAQYELTDEFAVGNSVLFNVLPDEVIDERFFFSWHFLTATIRF
jgi:opacity protein-like surface antigen